MSTSPITNPLSQLVTKMLKETMKNPQISKEDRSLLKIIRNIIQNPQYLDTKPYSLNTKVIQTLVPPKNLTFFHLLFVLSDATLQQKISRIISTYPDTIESGSISFDLGVMMAIRTISGDTFLHLAAMHSPQAYKNALSFYQKHKNLIDGITNYARQNQLHQNANPFPEQRNLWKLTAYETHQLLTVPNNTFYYESTEGEIKEGDSALFYELTGAKLISQIVMTKQRLVKKWHQNTYPVFLQQHPAYICSLLPQYLNRPKSALLYLFLILK